MQVRDNFVFFALIDKIDKYLGVLMSEHDDKPTIIIDFKALQAQQEAEDEILVDNDAVVTDLDSEMLFDSSGSREIKQTSQKNIYVFDFKSDFFEKYFKVQRSNITRLTELAELNTKLEQDPESIIVFFYNSNPKVVNQLCLQIRTKFSKTKSLIIAKNLSADKALKHSQTNFKANNYISFPFKESDFDKCIMKLN